MMVDRNNPTGSLRISGELNIASAKSLGEVLLEQLSTSRELALDLSAVESCDTAALQVLLAARQRATLTGKPFSIFPNSPVVTETAHALGFCLAGEPRIEA